MLHALARRLPALALLAVCAWWWPCAHAQQPIPPLAARVTDTTGTLSAAERAALEQKLAELEARKGAQIVVLMLPTTAPEAIEQYALRVAEEWQIGRGRVDDGIVVLVAKDDRRLRIEVGYGLEGAVPDALARRVIAERMVPRFYEDDYAGGLDAGIDALSGLIDGEPLPAPEGSESRPSADTVFGAIPFLLFGAALVAPLLRRMFGRLGGAAVLGVGAGLIAWVLSSLLLVALMIGAMAFVFGIAGIAGGVGRWSTGGGFGGARWGGRGGFGGGGGFRGGGGRFGGGGASGGW